MKKAIGRLLEVTPWYKKPQEKMFTVREIKRLLREQTNGGAWGYKPHYNPFKRVVWISGVCSRVWVNVCNGKAYFKDLDDDGCNEDLSCLCQIQHWESGLKLVRVRRLYESI